MEARATEAVEHVDVLIIGAGISGIGCAHYLQRRHPQRSFRILEARGRIGGTWDLFRYPGIRSDSDLHTFAFEFKPWVRENALADGAEILDYINEAAREDGIDQYIRTNHRVTALSWSSADACWFATICVRSAFITIIRFVMASIGASLAVRSAA